MARQSFLVAWMVVWLAGCASVSVDRVEDRAGARPPVDPAKIYVEAFTAPPDVFRVDRGGDHFERFRANFARDVSRQTAERIAKRLRPAEAIPEGKKRPRENSWLVTGSFVRVNQGSRVLRTAVGLGLGATKLETEVRVYDLSRPKDGPFLTFLTTGGTNSQPGVLAGLVVPNFWLMGLDAAVRIGPGLNADGIRTSRQITAVLSEYMARQGFLPPEQVSRAKKLGKWP